MAQIESSFDLILFSVAVGVAVWNHIVTASKDIIDQFERPQFRMAAALLQFLSLLLVLYVFLALTFALIFVEAGSLGPGGIALYLVLLAVLFASVPTSIGIYLTTLRELSKVETFGESLSSLILSLLIVVTVILAFFYRATWARRVGRVISLRRVQA